MTTTAEIVGKGRSTRRIAKELTKDDDTANWCQYVQNFRNNLLPTGALYQWPAGVTIPTNAISANGAAISRAKYSALFAVYGVTQGAGDGSTTFNVPTAAGFVIQI